MASIHHPVDKPAGLDDARRFLSVPVACRALPPRPYTVDQRRVHGFLLFQGLHAIRYQHLIRRPFRRHCDFQLRESRPLFGGPPTRARFRVPSVRYAFGDPVEVEKFEVALLVWSGETFVAALTPVEIASGLQTRRQKTNRVNYRRNEIRDR